MRRGPRARGRPREQHRVNRRIRVPEVRVIGADGAQLGVLQTQEAMEMAQEQGLDLVEIAASSRPPVCKIMDYGRFKYEQSKKKQAARRHASSIEVKEVKFRPKTDKHDEEFKVKHARRFLEEGNKVRLVVTFRGREITHPETGRVVLDRVVEATKDIGQVENQPTMEGRRMVMVLGPRAGVVKKAERPPPKPQAKSSAPAAEKPAEAAEDEAPAAQ